jgi:hypothetical protein
LPWFGRENRRAATRHRYDGSDTWIGLEGSLKRPCQILDISRTGVRLKVANAHSLPSTFTLILSKNSSGRRGARLIWRNGNEVGAEFLVNSSAILRSTTDPSGANSSSASRSTSDPPRVNSSPASRLSTGAAETEKSQRGKVIGNVISDKTKTEDSSKPSDLSEQLGRFYREKHSKKGKKKRMDLSQLRKKLGPDHVALIHALRDVDPESPDGKELASIIAGL